MRCFSARMTARYLFSKGADMRGGLPAWRAGSRKRSSGGRPATMTRERGAASAAMMRDARKEKPRCRRGEDAGPPFRRPPCRAPMDDGQRPSKSYNNATPGRHCCRLGSRKMPFAAKRKENVAHEPTNIPSFAAAPILFFILPRKLPHAPAPKCLPIMKSRRRWTSPRRHAARWHGDGLQAHRFHFYCSLYIHNISPTAPMTF